MSSTSTNKQQRIQLACQELEKAINNFEDNSEAVLKAKKEAEKLEDIKKTLDEIKKQLEQLSM